MLVDDDSVNRLLGHTILEKFNCQTDIAVSGHEAIDKLSQSHFDIVLLDIHMPDISGLDVAEYLRAKKKDRATKIVAVTAAIMKDDIKKYYQAGIDDFLIKPYKEINLFNKMCDVFKVKDMPNTKSKAEIILKRIPCNQQKVQPGGAKKNGWRKCRLH
ncbi:MAG: response regulator [Bacteroidales bacterium]|nr:response regulator [Bacteroidales bacterium]